MTEVYKLPGPKMMASASSIACKAAPTGAGLCGSVYTFAIGLPP